jgi:hypothetical protein
MTDSVAGMASSNTSKIQTTITVRGGGLGMNTGGRSNRSSRNNQQASHSNRPSTNIPKGNFKGSIPDMNGHFFECYEERGDRTQFPKTVEALGEYAAKNLKFPEDLKSMLRETMTLPTISEPADIPDTASKKEFVMGSKFENVCPLVR